MPMNVDDLVAGPELDALVAEKVMGWTRHYPIQEEDGGASDFDSDWFEDPKGNPSDVPNYSEDIAAAWAVVEKMRPLNVDLTNHARAERWCCVFFDRDGGSDGFIPELKGRFQEYTVAAAAPLAICRAALKAVGA